MLHEHIISVAGSQYTLIGLSYSNGQLEGEAITHKDGRIHWLSGPAREHWNLGDFSHAEIASGDYDRIVTKQFFSILFRKYIFEFEDVGLALPLLTIKQRKK